MFPGLVVRMKKNKNNVSSMFKKGTFFIRRHSENAFSESYCIKTVLRVGCHSSNVSAVSKWKCFQNFVAFPLSKQNSREATVKIFRCLHLRGNIFKLPIENSGSTVLT